MKTKTRIARSRPTAAQSSLPIEDDERHRDDVDGFVSRNREAINESLRRSRLEFAKGKTSSKDFNDIIAEGRKRHARQK